MIPLYYLHMHLNVILRIELVMYLLSIRMLVMKKRAVGISN